MPEFIAKTTLEIEISLTARNEDFALNKIEGISLDVRMQIPAKIKRSITDIYTSTEQLCPDWEIEKV